MPTKEEKLGLLGKLTGKEMEVMFYFCQGKTDEEISRIVGKEIKSIGARRTKIYEKLEINVPDVDKPNYLNAEFCPILPDLVPNEEAAKRWRPRVFGGNKGENGGEIDPETDLKTPDTRRTTLTLPIGYVLILVIIAAFLGFFLRPILQPMEAPTPVTVIITSTPENVNTLEPSITPIENTSEQVVNPETDPSDTPLPETPTIQPSETPVPTESATPLPPGYTYIDDFDDGLDPTWNRRFGAPLIVDRQLTSSEPLDLSLGDASWENYQVEFDYVGKFEDCDLGPNSNTLGIRAQDQNNMLVYVFSRCYQEWQYMVDGQWTAIPGTRHGGLMSPIHIVATVEGNEITYYNRSELLGSFIVEGYDSGPIYLHVKPGAQYDNFKVTILP